MRHTKFSWTFEIQSDHQISARRPDLVKIHTRRDPAELWSLQFLTDHRVKLKEKRK